MKDDIKRILDLIKKTTLPVEEKDELEEQGAEGGGTAAGGGGGAKPKYPTVTKWETGVARTGPANQIAVTKWRDIVKPNRGKANTLL